MLTVVRFWRDNLRLYEDSMKITKLLPVAVALLLLILPPASRAQAGDDDAAKNAQKAHVALDAMVKALGGQAWLDMKNQVREGFIAAFFHGKPDPGTTEFYEFHQWPDRDRVELTKHRDVV